MFGLLLEGATKPNAAKSRLHYCYCARTYLIIIILCINMIIII